MGRLTIYTLSEHVGTKLLRLWLSASIESGGALSESTESQRKAATPTRRDRVLPLSSIERLLGGSDDTGARDDVKTQLFELAIAAAGVGTFDWDLQQATLEWDDRLIELFGYDKSNFDRSLESFLIRLHPEDLDRVRNCVQGAVDSCGEFESEYRIVRPDGSIRWIGARGRVLCDSNGEAARMLGAAWDNSAYQEGRFAAASAAERTALLGRLVDELAHIMDPAEAARRLANLVVPTLCDWCVVTRIDDRAGGGLRRGLHSAVAKHEDANMQPVAEEYALTRLDGMAEDSMLVRALRTGEVQLEQSDGHEVVRATLGNERARQLWEQLNAKSVVMFPLSGPSAPEGTIMLCRSAPRGPFNEEDLVTATHVAARAGLVMENARLYCAQLELAEKFQRSLLTPPPEPDHLQIVVRYMPAAESAQVGGDWYDAFMQPNGATTLVIGDVVGHDSDAAAAMSQVRTLLRGVGTLDNDSPAEVLRKVDLVMERLQTNTQATAVVARLEQEDREVAEGVTRVRWSSAGHLPPMVIDPDGIVKPLLTPTCDVFLGVMPHAERNEYEVTLERASTLLLYTDGLVERRGESLEDGLVKLERTLSEFAQRDLDTLCDETLRRMHPEGSGDDVALIAVRLHRQDRPRPAEAGPNRLPTNIQPSPDVLPEAPHLPT